MHLFIGGFRIKEAIQTCKYYINMNQRPILNYAVESVNKTNIQNKNKTFYEYCNAIEHYSVYQKHIYNDSCSFDIALKYSSLDEPVSHMNALAAICKHRRIKCFVDAENVEQYYIYKRQIHDAILRFNTNAYVIYKTYQMYRKDALYELQNDVNYFQMKKRHLGIKLVRGAYYHQDKYSNQLFQNKEDTDQQFNDALLFLYEKYTHHPRINVNTLVASHNISCELASTLNGYLPKHQKFALGHLQGMYEKKASSYVNKNQDVYVYIPYGPVHEMIPYLARRAYENIDMFLPRY